jgi:hypothetical protein
MNEYLGSQSPRRLLAAVGAGMGLGGGVFTNIETDVAPPLRGAPPEVDSSSVRVATDRTITISRPPARSPMCSYSATCCRRRTIRRVVRCKTNGNGPLFRGR